MILSNQVRVVWRMMSLIRTAAEYNNDTTTAITTPGIISSSSASSIGSSISSSGHRNDASVVWPPMDMIDALFEKSSLRFSTARTDSSSTTTASSATDLPPLKQFPSERRLVIAASNGQYADFATNFAYSLLSHDIYNFVFVPLDINAYTILHERFPDHTLPVLPELLIASTTTAASSSTTTTTTEGASFRSKEFEILTSSRPIFLEHFLRQNITIFYNDIDMVWQYNAWETIDQLRYLPTQTPTAKQAKKSIQPPQKQYDVLLWKDGPVQICTCLIYMVPSTTSFRIIQEWRKEIQTHLHPNDQKAFLVMAQKHALLPSKRRTKTTTSDTDTEPRMDTNQVRIFDNSEQFPTGAMYDWETQIQQVQTKSSQSSLSQPSLEEWQRYVPAISSKQRKTNPQLAIIIHNNWIEGKIPKIQRFIQSQLWFVESK